MKRRTYGKMVFAYLSLLFLISCNGVATKPVGEVVTEIPIATATFTPSPTPELFEVSIKSFHDYNGNGQMDEGEPLLEGIINRIDDYECTTDIEGVCKLGMLPKGEYILEIVDGRDVEDFEKMRYILPSKTDRFDIGNTLPLLLEDNIQLNHPLAHGSFVLPFPKEFEYKIGTWFDRDIREGYVRDWRDNTDVAYPVPHTNSLFSKSLGVEDGHYAIDWIFEKETPIVACESGVITKIFRDERQSNPNDYIIHISTPFNLVMDYGHVNPVEGLEIGQEVERGQLLGYTVSHIYPPPFDRYSAHLVHVGFVPPDCNEYSCSLDPYPDFWTTTNFDYARVTISN